MHPSDTGLIVQWVTDHPYAMLVISAACYASVLIGLAWCSRDVTSDNEEGKSETEDPKDAA